MKKTSGLAPVTADSKATNKSANVEYTCRRHRIKLAVARMVEAGLSLPILPFVQLAGGLKPQTMNTTTLRLKMENFR